LALLRGTPLPIAAHPLIADPEDDDSTPDDDRWSGPPQRNADDRTSGEADSKAHSETDSVADTVAEIDRQVSEILARGIDQNLTRLLGQARAAGRLDGLA